MGETTVRLGSAELPGTEAVLQTAINKLATATVVIRPSDSADPPIDYAAEVKIKFDDDEAFGGSLLSVEPDGEGRVRLHCQTGVALDEHPMGVMVAQEFPPQDLVYAAARTAGFSEKNIHIDELKNLPSEPIEVVAGLRGLEVPGRREIGRVTLLPPDLAAPAIDVFEAAGEVPERLRESFERSQCFALVVYTGSRLFDAERFALDEIDATLGWLAIRSRYGLSHLPDGTLHRFSRERSRSLPRLGGVAAVRGTVSDRRWLRDPRPDAIRPPLSISDESGVLWPEPRGAIDTTARLAISAARRAFDGDLTRRVVALWEAWELYAPQNPEPVLSGDEIDRVKRDLPGWLSEPQRDRLEELLQLANNRSLRARTRLALARDRVPFSSGEWRALWKLRQPRNKSTHGGSAKEVDEQALDLACSLLARALVYCLGAEPKLA